METMSAGPVLERTARSDNWPKRVTRPAPAAWAASIMARRSSEASITGSVPQFRAPQAGRQQHGEHRRTDPEPDHRAEIIGARVAHNRHALLDQHTRDVLLNPGADVGEDADHSHRRPRHA